MEKQYQFIADTSGQRVDLFLSVKTGHSRAFVQLQISKGRVSVQGTPAEKPSQRLRQGESVVAHFIEHERLSLKPIAADLDIVFEDESLLILNKPQGWVVHPAAGHRSETIVHYLLHHFGKNEEFLATSPLRPGIVHRLDRGTSGLLLVAKNRKTLEALSLLFKERHMSKEYEALVWGRTRDQGAMNTLLGRHPKDRKKMSTRVREGRQAVTEWRRVEVFRSFSHLSLSPKTGRTHQLRVHLADIGHSIVGDPLYGKQNRRIPPGLGELFDEIRFPFLHAKKLSFRHPITQAEISVEAPRPANFQKAISLMRTLDRGD